MSDRLSCYQCKHRGELAGNAHSMCCHPATGLKKGHNQFLAMTDRSKDCANTLEIRGTPQGIKGGWFMWPSNFDPVWLESCNGFEQKTEKAAALKATGSIA